MAGSSPGPAAKPRPRISLWSAVRRGCSRFAAYSGNERIVLLSSAIDLLRIHWWLKRHGYQATYARISSPHRLAARVAAMPVEDVARLVTAAARWTIGFEKSCLRRAILLTWLLRSAGMRSDLVCGVGMGDRGWQGHAWVEIDGVALLEPGDVSSLYSNFQDQLSRRSGSAGKPSANSPIEPSSR